MRSGNSLLWYIFAKMYRLLQNKVQKFRYIFGFWFWFHKLTFWPSKIGYFWVESFKKFQHFQHTSKILVYFWHFRHLLKVFGTFGFGFDILFLSKVCIIFEIFLTVRKSKKSEILGKSKGQKFPANTIPSSTDYLLLLISNKKIIVCINLLFSISQSPSIN